MRWAEDVSILFVASYLTGFYSSSSATFSTITNRTSPNLDTGNVFIQIFTFSRQSRVLHDRCTLRAHQCAHLLVGEGHLPIAPEWLDPFLSLIRCINRLRVVGEPRVKEVGVPVDTFPFFEFCDHLPGEIVLRPVLVIPVFVVGFLGEKP